MANWFSSWRSSSTESSAESSSGTSVIPEGVKKVTESLYELYSPERTAAGDVHVEVDIIFFHGLQIRDYSDAYWKTWSRDGKKIWPQTLLGKELPRARILAVSYDSCARESETGGRQDLTLIAENLVKVIILDDLASVGRKERPVILVGHSFGGFVIKQFLEKAYHLSISKHHNEKLEKFLDNLCGIFYYATPHGGSRLADRVHKLPGNNHDVLGFLTTLGKDPARLNNWFRDWRATRKIPAFTIAEGHPTNLKLWGVNYIVVTEASAREDTDDYFTASENHINVCKPEDVRQGTFHYLLQFITDNVRKIKHQELTRSSNDSESLR